MARYKIQFWLDSKKSDEMLVADTVADLKLRRSFSSVVRDGIMIVNELRQGRVDLLLKLYPWIVDKIAEMLPPADPPPTPPVDSDYLLEQFRRMLEQQRGRDIPDARDYGIPAMKGTLGQGVKFTAPVDDDDDDDGLVFNEQKIDITANLKKGFASIGLQL